MQKFTTSHLTFFVVVNYYLRLAATADSSPNMIAKNFGQLNGAHLEFVVAHVNTNIVYLRFILYNFL